MSIGVRRSTLIRKLRDSFASSNVELPDKLKGGQIEKLFNFGKQLVADYRQAAVDAVQDCRDRPYRATGWGLLLASLYGLKRTNPSYNSYEDNLLHWQSEMCTVGAPIRNQAAYDHLLCTSHLHAQRQLKRLDLGICTLVLRQDHAPDVSTFVTSCSYLTPTYWEYLSERIVDVGLLNRWILLDRQLQNFDVNEQEWIQEEREAQTNQFQAQQQQQLTT